MFNPEKPPELAVEAWLNTTKPLTLAKLKGRVVVLLAFQMLCPGCVSHALPQARKISERFDADEVAMIGLHTVFEHHDVMTINALKAFNHEYRWAFPIAVDKANGHGLPVTMDAFEMRGTPTLLLFDRQGRLRRHYLGQVDDIRVAAEIMSLAIEDADASRETSIEIERKLASVLVDPQAHHHGHAHSHDHDHAHGDDCGCGPEHDHAHDHPNDLPAQTATKSARAKQS
jgi:peroxiredoxin